MIGDKIQDYPLSSDHINLILLSLKSFIHEVHSWHWMDWKTERYPRIKELEATYKYLYGLI